MRLPVRSLALIGLACLATGCADRGGAPRSGPLRVFAAASLVDLVGELAAAFERREAAAVELNLAGSNVLAQQILAAPVADVFLSADLFWVKELERAGRVVAGSRRALLGNRLVLIAAEAAENRITRPAELAGAGFSYLALADPAAVPAGRYARAALEDIPLDGTTLWRAVADRVAPTPDVRAALALVESDPEILGIVYSTDARQSKRVRVIWEFPPRGAARVTYFGAVVQGGNRAELAQRFLDFAGGPEGLRIAERYGFGAPPA